MLLAFEGRRNEEIAAEVGLERHQVGMWRRRWAKAFERLVRIECSEGPSALKKAIVEVLRDAPRSGSPGKFTAEQLAQIIAVACEPPEVQKKEIWKNEAFDWTYPKGTRRVRLEDIGLTPEEVKRGVFLNATHEVPPETALTPEHVLSIGLGMEK